MAGKKEKGGQRKEKQKSKKKVPEKKIKQVENLAELMKKAATIILVSTKSVPSPQFQKIKKELRGRADVKVVKKNILLRTIDAAGIPELNGLKEHVKADCAIALSDEDAFELAGWLCEHRSSISAKEGQTAEKDIEIEAGPTDLMPGPAISELGGLGLKVAVEEGKIAIKKPKVIAKQGDKITAGAASVLQKLGIKPFMIGLNPAVLYDSKNKKIYVGIKIDKKQATEELAAAHGKAVGFARAIGFYTKETIGYFLAKANAEMKSLEKFSGISKEEDKTEEKKEEDKTEEKKEEIQDKENKEEKQNE